MCVLSGGPFLSLALALTHTHTYTLIYIHSSIHTNPELGVFLQKKQKASQAGLGAYSPQPVTYLSMFLSIFSVQRSYGAPV